MAGYRPTVNSRLSEACGNKETDGMPCKVE